MRLFGDLSVGAQHYYRLLTETVVFTMLAERNLGPALHAVFPGGKVVIKTYRMSFKMSYCIGRLEEFISGHSMSWSEMRSAQFSSEIARNVALIHSLDIPVSKEPTWLSDTMRYENIKYRENP